MDKEQEILDRLEKLRVDQLKARRELKKVEKAKKKQRRRTAHGCPVAAKNGGDNTASSDNNITPEQSNSRHIAFSSERSQSADRTTVSQEFPKKLQEDCAGKQGDTSSSINGDLSSLLIRRAPLNKKSFELKRPASHNAESSAGIEKRVHDSAIKRPQLQNADMSVQAEQRLQNSELNQGSLRRTESSAQKQRSELKRPKLPKTETPTALTENLQNSKPTHANLCDTEISVKEKKLQKSEPKRAKLCHTETSAGERRLQKSELIHSMLHNPEIPAPQKRLQKLELKCSKSPKTSAPEKRPVAGDLRFCKQKRDDGNICVSDAPKSLDLTPETSLVGDLKTRSLPARFNVEPKNCKRLVQSFRTSRKRRSALKFPVADKVCRKESERRSSTIGLHEQKTRDEFSKASVNRGELKKENNAELLKKAASSNIHHEPGDVIEDKTTTSRAENNHTHFDRSSRPKDPLCFQTKSNETVLKEELKNESDTECISENPYSNIHCFPLDVIENSKTISSVASDCTALGVCSASTRVLRFQTSCSEVGEQCVMSLEKDEEEEVNPKSALSLSHNEPLDEFSKDIFSQSLFGDVSQSSTKCEEIVLKDGSKVDRLFSQEQRGNDMTEIYECQGTEVITNESSHFCGENRKSRLVQERDEDSNKTETNLNFSSRSNGSCSAKRSHSYGEDIDRFVEEQIDDLNPTETNLSSSPGLMNMPSCSSLGLHTGTDTSAHTNDLQLEKESLITKDGQTKVPNDNKLLETNDVNFSCLSSDCLSTVVEVADGLERESFAPKERQTKVPKDYKVPLTMDDTFSHVSADSCATVVEVVDVPEKQNLISKDRETKVSLDKEFLETKTDDIFSHLSSDSLSTVLEVVDVLEKESMLPEERQTKVLNDNKFQVVNDDMSCLLSNNVPTVVEKYDRDERQTGHMLTNTEKNAVKTQEKSVESSVEHPSKIISGAKPAVTTDCLSSLLEDVELESVCGYDNEQSGKFGNDLRNLSNDNLASAFQSKVSNERNILCKYQADEVPTDSIPDISIDLGQSLEISYDKQRELEGKAQFRSVSEESGAKNDADVTFEKAKQIHLKKDKVESLDSFLSPISPPAFHSAKLFPEENFKKQETFSRAPEICLQHSMNLPGSSNEVRAIKFLTHQVGETRLDMIAVCLRRLLVLWKAADSYRGFSVMHKWLLDKGEEIFDLKVASVGCCIVLVIAGNFARSLGRVYCLHNDENLKFDICDEVSFSDFGETTNAYKDICLLPNKDTTENINIILGSNYEERIVLAKWTIDLICFCLEDYQEFPEIIGSELSSLGLVQGSKCLLFSCVDSDIYLWNYNSCELLCRMNVLLSSFTSPVCLSAETKMGIIFLSLIYKKDCKVDLVAVNPETSRKACLKTLYMGQIMNDARLLYCSKFGACVISSFQHGEIMLWNIAMDIKTILHHKFGDVHCISFHPLNSVIALGTVDGHVYLNILSQS